MGRFWVAARLKIPVLKILQRDRSLLSEGSSDRYFDAAAGLMPVLVAVAFANFNHRLNTK